MKRKVKEKEVINTSVTVDEVYLYIKKQIKVGKYERYKDYTDEELFDLAKSLKPFIEIQLGFANRLALEQLRSIKKKK
jgi:hypothetical protein